MFSREKSTENHPILKATSQNKVHLRSRQPRRANTSRNPIQTLPKNKTTLLIRIFFHNSRLHFKGKTPIEHFSYRSTIVSVRTRGTSRSSRSLNKTKKERLFNFVSFFPHVANPNGIARVHHWVLCGPLAEHQSAESEGLRSDFVWEPTWFSLSYLMGKNEKTSFFIRLPSSKLICFVIPSTTRLILES